MLTGVWLTGLGINLLLTLVFAYLLASSLWRDERLLKGHSRVPRICVSGALHGSLALYVGLLLTYVQSGVVQTDLTLGQNPWPILVLAGYHLILLSLTLLVWERSYNFTRIGGLFVVGQIALSTIAIFLSWDFVAIWEQGTVFLSYPPVGDMLSLFIGMAVGGGLLYSSYIDRVAFLTSSWSEHQQVADQETSAYFLLALLFFAQFYVPRAVEGSIVDPFSVKFVGLAVGLGLAYGLNRFLLSLTSEESDEAQLPEKRSNASQKSVESLGPSLSLLGVGTVIVALFLVTNASPPEIPTRESLIAESVYLGDWLGKSLYLNLHSVVLPMTAWIVAAVLLRLWSRHGATLRGPTRGWLLITSIVGFFLFIFISFLQGPDAYAPLGGISQMIFPFILSPLIGTLLYERISTKALQGDCSMASKVHQYRCVVLYGTILTTAVVADTIVSFALLFAAQSYIFIGALGIYDGIFWVPLLTVFFFEVIDSLRELL
jgi:hypothetical protein